MSKILILNGAPRKNGNTAELIRNFTEGALESGSEVREAYLADMEIRQCMGCTACTRNGGNCVIEDDMQAVYENFEWADIIVFASPVYFSSITGILKVANDRLFAMWNRYGIGKCIKKSVFLLTSAAPVVDQPLGWYNQFKKYNGWEDLGVVRGQGNALGVGKADDPETVTQARKLGRSIR